MRKNSTIALTGVWSHQQRSLTAIHSSAELPTLALSILQRGPRHPKWGPIRPENSTLGWRGVIRSLWGGAFAPKNLPSNSLFRAPLAGVQPWWIQGDSKVGTESASLEITYLITDRKGLED